MSEIDVKRRAEELAAVSLQIKHLSKESKLQEINQLISESQKMIPTVATERSFKEPMSVLRDSQQTITSIVPKSPRRKQDNPQSGSPWPRQEIISLQEYNLKLEEELRVCRAERDRYRERCEKAQKQLEEISLSEKNLRAQLEVVKEADRKPYFEIHDMLWVHASRLPIAADRVEYVAYTQAKVALREEMLYIRDKEIRKEFALTNIARVIYYPSIMCVQVAGSGLVKDHYLFKFNSDRALRKWDRALYMNRKLSICLNSQKLFHMEFPEDQQKKQHYRDSVITEKTEEYEPSHNDIPQQQPKSTEYMKIQEGDDSPKEDHQLPRQLPTPHQTLEIANQPVNQTVEPSVEPFKIRYAQSYIVPAAPQSYIQIQQQTNKNSNIFPNITPMSTINQVPEVSQHANSIVEHLRPPNAEQPIYYPNPNSPRPSEIQRKTAVQNLRRGYVMTKYAKWGLNPHEKFVYLKPESMELHWEDIKSKTDKKISLKAITGFQQKFGQGMAGKTKKLDIEQCVVIQTKDRVLEFSSDSKEKMLQFLTDIDALLRSSNAEHRH